MTTAHPSDPKIIENKESRPNCAQLMINWWLPRLLSAAAWFHTSMTLSINILKSPHAACHDCGWHPSRPQDHGNVLALSDSQLRAVWAAADRLPVEKRGVFLERLIAQLQLRGSRFTIADLEDIVRSALSGLVQQSAA
jgi:hypothetical protein